MSKIISGFNRETTAEEVLKGVDLEGKTVVITGASGGLGALAAELLAGKGAEVIATARNLGKGQAVIDNIREITGNQHVYLEELELASFKNIRAFAKRVLAKHPKIHVLMNNAGAGNFPELQRTDEGHELMFGANHLGHFLLTSLLLPALRAAAPSRVVVLASSAHRMGGIVFEDVNYNERSYDNPYVAYGQSKTANVLFAVEFDRLFKNEGIRANAVHPGVPPTEFGRHVPGTLEENLEVAKSMGFFLPTMSQGVATQCWAATAPELADVGGQYLMECRISEINDEETNFADDVRSYALNPADAKRLWALSEELIGQDFA